MPEPFEVPMDQIAQENGVAFYEAGGQHLFPIKNDKGEVTGFVAYLMMTYAIHVPQRRDEQGRLLAVDHSQVDEAVKAAKAGFFGTMMNGADGQHLKID